MKPFYLLLLILTILTRSNPAEAQSQSHPSHVQITGRVIDKATGEPLEMAVVTDIRSLKNTLTDQQGNFLLKSSSQDSVLLSISFIGYKTQQINLKPDKTIPGSVKTYTDIDRKIKASGRKATILIRLEKGQLDLKEVVITGNPSGNTFHTLSRIDLNMAPARSAQDLLRLVPGLFIAQHQGGGKAEQIFLRGFDADHGTDVDISVDGMPVNMVSHAHGQGYADLHFLIPEIVADYDFGKGPYYSAHGDFNTAGYVAYHTIVAPDRNMVKLEGGQFNTGRAVAMLNLLPGKSIDRKQSAYIAGEALYSDGPFHLPEHFSRFNIFGRFNSMLGSNNFLNLTVSTLSSGWRASGEIPNRAIAEGYIPDRFGAIDSSQGGYTSRTNANIRLTTALGKHFTLENQAFYSYYFFNLISNFTFFYFYPASGDEFRQHESRNLYGYKGKLSHQAFLRNATLTSSLGWGLRDDHVNPSYLAHTLKGATILNFIQYGRIREGQVNGYWDETLQSGKWLFNAGLRLDFIHFNYQNQAPLSDSLAAEYIGKSPNAQKAALSPKINIQYTLNPEVQFYVKAGKGFHSNDARVVIANQGYEILPAAYGADLGINWKPLPRLFINTALWYLYLQQEFTYGADLGDVEVQPGGKTVRKGIDFSARYQITNWLFGHLNIDLARPRELNVPKGQDYLPLAPTFTSTAGLDVRLPNGLNGGVSYRYLRNRPANEDNTLTALGYFIVDLTVNYTKQKYEIGLAVENLFNQSWNESQFEYISRLKYETHPVDEVSYTPGVPFFAKLKLAVFF